MNNKKKRVLYLDIAKGIGIISVIAGHTFYGVPVARNVFFYFNISIFILISGILFKENDTFKDIIKKSLKLFIPYVVALIVIWILTSFLYGENYNCLLQILMSYSNLKTFLPDTRVVGSLWFIPFLIFLKILFWIFRKISRKNDIVLGVECIIATIIGVIFKKYELYLPWSIDIAFSTILVFYVGYILRKYNLLDKLLYKNLIYIALLIICIIGLKFTRFEAAMRIYSLISILLSIMTSLIVLKIAKIIEIYMNPIAKMLSIYGENSMIVLIMHRLETCFIVRKFSS